MPASRGLWVWVEESGARQGRVELLPFRSRALRLHAERFAGHAPLSACVPAPPGSSWGACLDGAAEGMSHLVFLRNLMGQGGSGLPWAPICMRT